MLCIPPCPPWLLYLYSNQKSKIKKSKITSVSSMLTVFVFRSQISNHKSQILYYLTHPKTFSMKNLFLLAGMFVTAFFADAQNVGIGTLLPKARLHVADSSVVFSGPAVLPAVAGAVPVSGAGSRMIWYADKAAFRAGGLQNSGLNVEFWNTENIGIYSFAGGYNTLAIGPYSFAMGINAKAHGYASIAIGSNAVSQAGAVALGSGLATAQQATALGFSTAAGEGATSMGYGTKANGDYSVAAGYQSLSNGNSSVAMGNYAYAFQPGSTAFGISSVASGTAAGAIGYSVTARSYASFTIGRLNDSIISSNKSAWVLTDPLFSIGNGISDAARSNALVVYKNANLDIKGFTRLGSVDEGAPRIKVKKLQATTSGSQNSFTFIQHGLNAAKILAINAVVDAGGYYFLPHSPDAGAVYTVNLDPNNGGTVAIGVKTTALSSYVMAKTVKILITYEE